MCSLKATTSTTSASERQGLLTGAGNFANYGAGVGLGNREVSWGSGSIQGLAGEARLPDEGESCFSSKSSFEGEGAVLGGRTSALYPCLEGTADGTAALAGSDGEITVAHSGLYPRLEKAGVGSVRDAFAQRLDRNQVSAFEGRLKELQGVEQSAVFLAAGLKTRPYEASDFFDKKVESTALYALREGTLTEFEAANVLLFKAACDAYGRENVEVHFLQGRDGAIDEVEWERFLVAAAPLLADSSFSEVQGLALRAVSLPRHQFLFFSVPEDEVLPPPARGAQTIRQKLWSSHSPFMQVEVGGQKRRMIMTPQLLQEYFYKLLPKKDQPAAYPVLRFSSSGGDFLRREIFIPSSLPEISKTDALDRYTADLHRLTTDLCNPHLGALQELWEVVQKTPYAYGAQKWNYQHPIDRYREHQCFAYREMLSKQGPNAPLQGLFWDVLVDLLAEYKEWFDFGWEVSGLKCEFRSLIAYISSNSERWKAEYGITLESLAQSREATTWRTQFPTQALRELATECLEERTFGDTRKKLRDVRIGFSNVLVVLFAEQTGGD